jgi:hypothetical protein
MSPVPSPTTPKTAPKATPKTGLKATPEPVGIPAPAARADGARPDTAWEDPDLKPYEVLPPQENPFPPALPKPLEELGPGA